MVTTHWVWPTSPSTSSRSSAAVAADRLAAQEGLELAGPAGEREEVLRVTLGAADARKAILKEPAVLVPAHLLVEEAPPGAVAPLEALLPLRLHLLVVGLDEPVQWRRPGVTRPVACTLGGSHGSARSRGVDRWRMVSPRRPAVNMGDAATSLADRGQAAYLHEVGVPHAKWSAKAVRALQDLRPVGRDMA